MHIHALIIYSLFGDENYVYKQQKNHIYVYRQRLEGSHSKSDVLAILHSIGEEPQSYPEH